MIEKIRQYILQKKIDRHSCNNVSGVLVFYYKEIGGIDAVILAYILGRSHARWDMTKGAKK